MKNKNPKLAFVGNPNCGKTTLFNAFTGAHLKVANWPGVTVERKEGTYTFQKSEYTLVDLPGTYSLDSYSIDESVTRDYILKNDVDIIINVVDASSLERNLYLTLQLAELGKPVVVALNMMDIIHERGMEIDLHRLPEILGMPVVPVSARKRTGLDTLMHAVEHHNNINQNNINNNHSDKSINNNKNEQENQKSNKSATTELRIKSIKTTHPQNDGLIKVIYCDKIEQCIKIVQNELESIYPTIINHRWHAIKILCGDICICEKYPIKDGKSLIGKLEHEIINERYTFIEEIIKETVFGKEEKAQKTEKIDKIFTNKFLGIPIFFAIMAGIFALTFTLGGFLAGFVELAFDALSTYIFEGLEKIGTSPWLISLITDGIIGGVGGVLTFLPNIAILFIAMALLEDSGYMARVAYVMDGLMSSLGLSGKSFIPMVLGFGCSVPAIMATRTLENEKDIKRTIMITPFMSCSAKIPVYVLLSGMFFGKYATLVALSMYIIGIIIAIITAKIQQLISKKKSVYTLLIELPEYKTPNSRTVGIYVWEKTSHYLKRAGTTIFIVSILMWFITAFGPMGYGEINDSFASHIGGTIAIVFSPMGLGAWQSTLCLISGMAAKEMIVSGMEIIFSGDVAAGLANIGFGAREAYSLMLFSLLSAPCMAAIATIKSQTRSWTFTVFCFFMQCAIAWGIATLFYQISGLFV